jgi:uncharacterized protein (TIGR02996 family)
MEDGPLLLRAVLENLQDDTVRLVYADWLQEQGDSDWAEYIRWQLRPAKRGRVPNRVREITGRMAARWRTKFAAATSVGMSRGFVSEVTAYLPNFLRNARIWFARHPIERVELGLMPIENDQGLWVWEEVTNRVGKCVNGPDELYQVPACLFQYGVEEEFDTIQEARDAVNDSAFFWAREQAGLPLFNE